MVFGDSIAHGYFDSKGGWVNHIATTYKRIALANLSSPWTSVYNLGIAGDTVFGVRDRLNSEIETRRVSDDDECIVIAVGINDAILRKNRVTTEVYDFQEVYDDVIDMALKISPRVICVGLTAVKESETDPWVYSSSGKQWKNNRINLFEDTIKQSAENKQVPFVPIHDEFLRRTTSKNMLADGLHPNDAGHSFIAREVMAAIQAIT